MTTPRLHRVLLQQVMTDRLLGVDWLPCRPGVSPARGTSVTQDDALDDQASPDVLFQSAVYHASEAMDDSAHAVPQSRSGQDVSRSAASRQPDASPTPAVASVALDWPAGPLSATVKLQLLQTLDEQQVRPCQACGLHAARQQTVFGEGDPMARLMFIGEGPGEQEDRLGRPFVGPAGQLLDKMIVAMGLSRQAVYIANAVKCRPPSNRTPTPIETQTCGGYLDQQIAIIQPQAIVTLGGPATKHILHTATGITALRGRWHEYRLDTPRGRLVIPVMPTFHPAFLLRSYTTENRRKVWEDLQAVMARIQADAGA